MGRRNFFLLTVDIFTTQGVTFFDTAEKARWAASISAGTSLTGGSASATGRLDLNMPGSRLSDCEQEEQKRSTGSKSINTDNGRIILTTCKDSL